MFKLNVEFAQHVEKQGVTLHDQHGSAMLHTYDVELVQDFLRQVNEDHTGVSITGIRTLNY